MTDLALNVLGILFAIAVAYRVGFQNGARYGFSFTREAPQRILPAIRGRDSGLNAGLKQLPERNGVNPLGRSAAIGSYKRRQSTTYRE